MTCLRMCSAMKRKADDEIKHLERPAKQHQSVYHAGLWDAINQMLTRDKGSKAKWVTNSDRLLFPTDAIISNEAVTTAPWALRRFTFKLLPGHAVTAGPRWMNDFEPKIDDSVPNHLMRLSRPCGGYMRAAYVHLLLSIEVTNEILGINRCFVGLMMAYFGLNPALVRLIQEYATYRDGGPEISIGLVFAPPSPNPADQSYYGLLQAFWSNSGAAVNEVMQDQVSFISQCYHGSRRVRVPYDKQAEEAWASNHF